MVVQLIDTHSHLHFVKEFPDRDEVLLRAEAAGVGKQVLVGTEMSDSVEAGKFVQARDGLVWTVGVHPHEANQVTPGNLARLRDMLTGKGEFAEWKKLPVAIGEIGLDYFRNLQPVEVQKKAFQEQLELALELDLPVVIHIRDAYPDAMEILEESGNKKVVMHCFSGGMKEAEWAWERGFMTSFSGVVTYPKNLELQEVVRRAPAELFVVETDCPFLAPQVFRGKRNEPAFVAETAKFIAQLRGESLEVVAAQTTSNAEKFFGI